MLYVSLTICLKARSRSEREAKIRVRSKEAGGSSEKTPRAHRRDGHFFLSQEGWQTRHHNLLEVVVSYCPDRLLGERGVHRAVSFLHSFLEIEILAEKWI